jgi:hypothetical protein
VAGGSGLEAIPQQLATMKHAGARPPLENEASHRGDLTKLKINPKITALMAESTIASRQG